MYAGDVRGHQVRGALNAFESPAPVRRERAREQRLAEPRHAFEKHVTTRYECEAKTVHDMPDPENHLAEPCLELLLECLCAGTHAMLSFVRCSARASAIASTRVPAAARS